MSMILIYKYYIYKIINYMVWLVCTCPVEIISIIEETSYQINNLDAVCIILEIYLVR